MKIDGFRFDLASVFTIRSDGGRDLDHPSLISDIGFLAARHGVRMIAEAWDIESYLLGRAFPGINWRQWNGKYRDDLRDFVRGVPGRIGALMQRLYGSDDLFPDDLQNSYRPFQSVNFITAHDGFCLYDLVSYNYKHNEANGHGQQRWHRRQPKLELRLGRRRRRARGGSGPAPPAGAELLLPADADQRHPMFCAGDEFLATRQGNNNPLQPGQRDQLSRLGSARAPIRISSASCRG